MTRFQNTLPNDTETIWEIVKIFHPNIPEIVEQGSIKKDTLRTILTRDKIHTYCKYDWVCIEFKVRGYGLISISVTNGEHSFWGEGITKQMFEKAYRKGEVKFKSWVFSSDKSYEESKEQNEKLSNQVSSLLKSKGYLPMSPTELYNHYYRD